MRKLDYNLLITEIQKWIKNYIISAEVDGVIIGISGGIDSAVTTVLCVNALGKENVIGLSLPCSSIPEDIRDAEQFARKLGIQFIKIDLTRIYNKFIEITSPLIESNQIAMANLKPRLRMMTLYYIGQSLGKYLVGGTSNRTELAIGYFTKYGDGGVDFEPIGELYKSEIRKIAKLLNVPKKIIKKPPSAGLWVGQTDEAEIGLTYEILDEIVYRIDSNLPMDDLKKDNVKKVKEMIRSSCHKKQMPPSYKISNE
jgi:NAD+ synthase